MKQLFLLTTVLVATNIASVDCKPIKVKSCIMNFARVVLCYPECVEVGR